MLISHRSRPKHTTNPKAAGEAENRRPNSIQYLAGWWKGGLLLQCFASSSSMAALLNRIDVTAYSQQPMMSVNQGQGMKMQDKLNNKTRQGSNFIYPG
jgi:hypothetical protein